MTLTDFMWQEKKEEEDSQALRTAWMEQYKNPKNVSKKSNEGNDNRAESFFFQSIKQKLEEKLVLLPIMCEMDIGNPKCNGIRISTFFLALFIHVVRVLIAVLGAYQSSLVFEAS